LYRGGGVQPDLQPNPRKNWRSVGQATDDLLDFELGGGTEKVPGASGDKAWTVFKTVARPASWSRVGSTPMHLRHPILNSKSAQAF
jgi:hypothetical protein